MIAKDGDRVRVVKDGEDGGTLYGKGQEGKMIDKAPGDDCGGSVWLDSGEEVYLYIDEYEVIGQSTYKESPKTAESLRDSYKSLEASLVSLQEQVAQTEAEKIRVVEQLKEMGFVLAPQEEIEAYAEDYSDPKTWKPGFMVKCVNQDGWGNYYTRGHTYEVVSEWDGFGLKVRDNWNSKRDIKTFLQDFEFYSPF